METIKSNTLNITFNSEDIILISKKYNINLEYVDDDNYISDILLSFIRDATEYSLELLKENRNE